MPRKGDIVFVPAAVNGAAGLSEDMIPDDIKRDVEECYLALKVRQGRMQVEFDTAEEVKDFRRQVESYCKVRPADVAEILKLYVKTDEDGNTVPVVENGTDVAEQIKKTSVGGPLKFRASPVKNLPDTAIAFRIIDMPPADKKTTEIRDAVEAVKESVSGDTDKVESAPETATGVDAATSVPVSDTPSEEAPKPAPTRAGTSKRK